MPQKHSLSSRNRDLPVFVRLALILIFLHLVVLLAIVVALPFMALPALGVLDMASLNLTGRVLRSCFPGSC